MKTKNLLLAFLIFNFSFLISSAQGVWIQKADFAGPYRANAVAFSIGTKGYIGMGTADGGTTALKDFWEWNKVTNAWTQKANFALAGRYNAVGFSIGTKGYVGGGKDALGTSYNDFWEYDPSTNSWTSEAVTPGVGRNQAVGFSIGTKGYVGTGLNGSSGLGLQDFYEWDQATNTWTTKAAFSGTARSGAVGFSIGAKGYIGTGKDVSGNASDFWEYDPSTNGWTQKADFAGTARSGAVGFSIGTKGYIGTGLDALGSTKDFWEWDQASNSWSQKPDFAGTARVYAAAFSIGTSGYVGTGNVLLDFYELSTACSMSLAVTTTNSSCGLPTGTASVVATNGAPPYTYAWTNGDKTPLADSLPANLYMILVTDASGCTNSKAVLVTDAGSPTITVTNVKNVSCNGGSDGGITVSLAGGAQPYNYMWGNGATTLSISNLSAGPIEFGVQDANGCVAMKSILVTEPTAVSFADSIHNASCGSSDGSETIQASGGTPPYSYLWGTGATTKTISNIAAGTYSATVTDSKGCTASGMGSVVNLGAAIVTLDSIKPAGCGGQGGSIYVSVSGGSTPYTYVWSNGAATEDITNVSAGTYGLTVYSNGNPCTGAFTGTIPSKLPVTPAICIVTVDSFTGKNICVFDKGVVGGDPGISHYEFWRETTTAGVYQFIGSKPANQLSIWTDPSANSLQRAWRYKINAVDTCGNESPLSVYHKTIHLSASVGINNTVNLNWDNYEGFSFGTYIIYRYTAASGWMPYDSVPASLNSYTDLTPPLPLTNVSYFVSVRHPGVCAVTIAKDPQTMTSNLNLSKSNVNKINPTPNGIQSFDIASSLQVYPNPSNGKFNVQSSVFKAQRLEVYNVMGEMVYQSSLMNHQSSVIDLSAQQNGIYFLRIKTDEGTATKKLVISK